MTRREPVELRAPEPFPGHGERYILVRWLVPDGGTVRADDHVCELDTVVSAIMWFDATADGTLRHMVPEGSVVEPDAIIGHIVPAGD